MKALEVYKYLPKTNCRDCSYETCLAFAIHLASGQSSFEKCPHLSEEARLTLGRDTRPAIKTIKIKELEIGGETVMFRHEKKFVNKTAICCLIDEHEDAEKKLRWINDFKFMRIGEELKIDMIALRGNDEQKFLKLVEYASRHTKLALMYVCNECLMQKALEIYSKDAIICSANLSNYKVMLELAKRYKCKLVASAYSLDELSELINKLQYEEIILNLIDLEQKPANEQIKILTTIRMLALRHKDFGYPIVTFPKDEIDAGIHTAKYSSMMVLDIGESDQYMLYPLLALRQNIFTDPQKPLQMEAKIYEVNNPDKDSKVLLTTNFSLTYFTVSQDLEAAKMPCYLLVIDTEGQSVLTAFASDKLNADNVAKFISKTGIKSMVNHDRLIIPGLVPMLSGEIEEKTGLKVLVGPRNSSEIKEYFKENGA